MKIAIVGAQGTGKTTLLNDLAKELPDYKVLPEAARLAADIGFKLDENVTIETEIWLIAKQYELEQLNGDNWIADRSFIDLLAYIKLLFPHVEWIREALYELLDRKRYDLIIYLPAGEFEIEDDGLRNKDKHFQAHIDEKILDVLNAFEIKYYKVTGLPLVRLEKVKQLIQKYAGN